ncbi:MAG TPA: STAS domain-containing protein [Isosphaeraceae bacterium]
MGLNVRIDDGVAILSNIGRLMNDPRHFDSSREVEDLIDQGVSSFVIELREVGTLGPAGLGLLTTLTRAVRRDGGDLVLAGVRPALVKYFEEMSMDTYWEIFPSVAEAKSFFERRAR